MLATLCSNWKDTDPHGFVEIVASYLALDGDVRHALARACGVTPGAVDLWGMGEVRPSARAQRGIVNWIHSHA